MLEMAFQQVFTVQGTLAANHTFTFVAPFGMTLTHVSMSNASANAGTLDIGESTDPDGYLDGATFGVSGACTEVGTPAGFTGALAGSQYPHLDDGDVFSITIIDHGSHMAGACVVLTWLAG
jgi:NADPH-dependent curcumin reductase CurA